MTNESRNSPAGGDHEHTGTRRESRGHEGIGRDSDHPDSHDGHDHGHSSRHGHQHDDGVVIRWKLNVQGVEIEVPQPKLSVRDAIKLAGFNPETPWSIILKVAGEPKREVDLTFVLDLRHKGIEKLRLTPRQINNGDVSAGRRRDFALLSQDEDHLDRLGLRWDTFIEAGRRWLIIRGYHVPEGYSAEAIDVAIEVPASYPGAQLDMFYCHPALARRSSEEIPQAQHRETIAGLQFQRWSRHRNWDPAQDTLATHLALVEESLGREVGQ